MRSLAVSGWQRVALRTPIVANAADSNLSLSSRFD
jgi:hypothetical protein